MAAQYTCSLSRSSFSTQNPIPDVGSHGRSTQTPRNTRHISSLPIQESARWVSHWSDYKCETILLVVRRVWLAIRSRQTSHTKKPQSAANIPLLTQLRMESFQLIRIPQSILWHLTEYRLWWGPNVYFVFPSENNIWCGDDDAFWAPYGESLNSFIAGHKKKKKMKLFLVTDCESSWQRVRSIALGHVVGRCDKTKMRRAFLSPSSTCWLVSCLSQSGSSISIIWPIPCLAHCNILTVWGLTSVRQVATAPSLTLQVSLSPLAPPSRAFLN